MAGLGNIPTSATWTEEVDVSALRKPYPGAPKAVSQGVTVCEGFNVRSVGQPSMLQFFTMGSSTSLGMTPPGVNIQKGTKSAPNTNPEPKNRPGWYYSELSYRWCKTEELFEKERREADEAEKLPGETSQPTTTSGTMISAAQAA